MTTDEKNQIDNILRQGLALDDLAEETFVSMDEYIVSTVMKHYCLS